MITTLLFDIGGTLHTVSNSPERRTAFAHRLISRLAEYGIDIDTPYEEFGLYLHQQGEFYKHETEGSLVELPQPVIWNEYYLARYHIGEEKLAPIAEELSFMYDYERVCIMRRPRLKETMEELHAMGIRLGMISNIISTSFVPHALKEYGIDHLMESITMSSETGCRKPGREIFDIARARMGGISAAETGYVGDTISRDVLGARNAELGLMIQIKNPAIAHRDAAFTGPDAPKPDYLIDELWEIPAIIREVNGR